MKKAGQHRREPLIFYLWFLVYCMSKQKTFIIQ